MSDKPKILILGGCGFIGRSLVEFLVRNDLVSEIRVVDKTPPQMAWLNTSHNLAFESKKVTFYSANLINPVSCKGAFSLPKSGKWDIVVNCAAETRPKQSEPVYREGVYSLSLNCAKEAANINANKYIELSSGYVNSSEKIPLKEDCDHNPWTLVAKYKLQVEKEFENIENLNYTILRLPIVYGPGDKRGLMPRIIIAALYKYLNETMKLLWTDSLKLNTIHVSDVISIIWEFSNNPKTNHEIFNIVDDNYTTQGSISNILANIFCIKVDYWGIALSTLAKANMNETVSEINDKHMGPWAEVCSIDEILNTPLTPYLDENLLYYKHLNLDNTKLKSTGYKLRVPKLTEEYIREIINDYIQQKLFPKSLFL